MNLLSVVTVFFYVLGSASLGFAVLKNTDSPLGKKSLILPVGFVAVFCHILLLYNTIHVGTGLNLGFYNAASLISCVIVLFVLVTALKKAILNLTLFIMPMAAITVTLSLVFPDEQIIGGDSQGLKIHILLSIVAYSLLTIAAIQACLLAFQENRLRNKHPTPIMNFLPPLQMMEHLLVQVIVLGFFILSLSLATGFMFLHDIFSQHLVHKTVLSILAWLLFAILLWGRWAKGWRGQTIIRWTLGGFLSLMLAYFGSKFVLELILS